MNRFPIYVMLRYLIQANEQCIQYGDFAPCRAGLGPAKGLAFSVISGWPTSIIQT
jgi:hypothetical protein